MLGAPTVHWSSKLHLFITIRKEVVGNIPVIINNSITERIFFFAVKFESSLEQFLDLFDHVYPVQPINRDEHHSLKCTGINKIGSFAALSFSPRHICSQILLKKISYSWTVW